MPHSKKSLDERVSEAAQAALEDHKYASPVDIFIGIGWLTYSKLWWKKKL